MPDRTELDPDDRLARLGRQWFEDVRRQNPPEPLLTRGRQRAGSVDDDGGIIDWLFGDSNGDDGGDCGD